jgi:hypothetical protein
MSEERKYPCTARYFDEDKGCEVEITVLSPASKKSCCGDEVLYAVELPDGYPEPPAHCGTWMMEPGDLKF